MTTSTIVKSVNHHENFVKAIEPSEKHIALLAEFGFDEEFTKLFVNAANWISINDNKRRSMKFFKKNQPLVDAKVAEVFEEDGKQYMRFTSKADKIMSGRKNKINVSQETRVKVKQSKGYVAQEVIPEAVQQFLDENGFTIRSTELTKANYRLKVSHEKGSKFMVVIYEEKVKLRFYSKNKQNEYEFALSNIDSSIVEHHKMSNSFGFIQLDQSNLNQVTSEMIL